jgi:hypothetical protein
MTEAVPNMEPVRPQTVEQHYEAQIMVDSTREFPMAVRRSLAGPHCC